MINQVIKEDIISRAVSDIKKRNGSVQMTVRISKTAHEIISARAERSGVSANELVGMVLSIVFEDDDAVGSVEPDPAVPIRADSASSWPAGGWPAGRAK